MRSLLSTVMVLIFCGCTSVIRLVPSPEAHVPGGLENAALGRDSGVQILVEAQAWSGRPEIAMEVTPLRVTIENRSGKHLRIRYSEFTLRSSRKTFVAIPPYQIQGTIEGPKIMMFYPPMHNPDISHKHFFIAPYLSALYPDMPVIDSSFQYDPDYYDRYYTVWTRIELPTEEMLRLALPDGVLEDSGYLSGFLYFERVRVKPGEIMFVAELICAIDGERFGKIEIPFRVLRQ